MDAVQAELASLSPGERAVLAQIATGATNRQVARSQGLSPKTVANRLTSIYRKLGVGSRTEATRLLLDASTITRPARPTIEREEELVALAAQREAAMEGRGSAIGIVGDAGCGKTMLAQQAMAAARTDGLDAWRVVATMGGGGPLGLLGAIAARLGAPAPLPIGTPDAWLTAAGRVLDLLEAQSEQTPSLIVLDDIHRADQGSLLALPHVLAHLDGTRIGVIATWRPDEAGPATRAVAGVVSEVLRPAPLSMAGVIALVTQRWGVAPSAALRSDLEGANGNPFLLTELLDDLESNGALDLSGGELTVNRQTGMSPNRVVSRLQQLPQPARDTVVAAALLGSPIDRAELADATGLSQSAIAAHLGGAVGVGLVVRDDDGALLFRHDLVMQALVDGLGRQREVELRRRIAKRLAASAAPAHRVARQVTDPAVGDGFDAARWMQAAARAELAVAPASAARRLRRALAMSDDPPVRLSIRLDLAQACINRADLPAAAGVLADAQPDVELGVVAPGGHPLDVASLRGEAAFLAGNLTDALDLLSEVGRSDHPRAALRLADAGWCGLLLGRLDTALEWAERAESHPNVGFDHRGAVAAAMLRAWVATLRLEPTALTTARLAVRRADLAPDGHWEMPWLVMGQALAAADDPEGAVEAYHRGAEQAAELGMGWHAPVLSGFAAAALERGGFPEDAEVEARIGIRSSRDASYVVGSTIAHVTLTRVLLARGDVEGADRALTEAETDLAKGLSDSADLVIRERARILSTRGRHADAVATIGFLVEALRRGGVWLRVIEMLTAARDIAVAADDGPLHDRLDLARNEAARAVFTRNGSTKGTDPTWTRATVDLDMARRSGDVGQAWRAASGFSERSSQLRAVARGAAARLELAANGEVDPLRLGQAVTSLVAVGWTHEAASVASSAADRGVAVGVPERPTDGPASLTPSERRVLRSLAEDRPNGEMARWLRMSRPRIEHHLTTLRKKLDAGDRKSLVALARRYDG